VPIGPLPPPHLAVYIVAEICMALDYAHQRRDTFTNKPLNLVHQDISPSNIMISRFGNVKLIDFGIATVRRHRKEKKDNKLRGKIPYMAPEQLIMGNHPDHRSDIFSLGLVLYESITGERLFTSQEEIITAGKNPKWFKKALRGKRIQPALAKILFKALEIDLTKRYQTANHMYIDLLQYLISCNETGELMDDLAQYLSEQFSSHQSPINSPGTNYTPTANTYDSSHYSYTPESNDLNHWDHNQYDLNEPISPPYSKPKTPPKPSNFSKHLMAAPQKFQSNYQTLEFDIEGEEELKTVIDVIRISARNYKKRIIQFCFGIFLALITFAVFDIIYGWTKTGIWIYDLLFPPAIEIKTIPANAIIYLDEVPVKGRTPLSIDKISPGVHKLDLALEGYKTIVKSLFVPREGAIKVQGEAEVNSRAYLFRFSTEIEIKSDPANADVFINGVRFNQKTPCNLSWDVGTPLSISLEIPGFEKLTEYSLNTVEGYDEVEDRRFWDLKVFNDDYIKYSITGIFRKHVVIETIRMFF